MSLRSVPRLGLVRKLVLGAWLAVVPMASTTAADAQATDEQIAKAREQFRQGVGLEAASDWAGALAQFEAVARVKMTPQVRFHIARCQHKLGKLLEALGGYRLAAHEASQEPNATETLAEARKGIEEVQAKIPKLLIERGVGAEAASVTLDGVALGDSSIGKAVPVNPGSHTIRFKLPNGRSDQRTVRVKEGDTKNVMLTADLEDSGGESPAPGPDPGTDEASTSVLPWVAVGVGGVSLLASGTFYLMRKGTINDHDAECVNGVCPRTLEDTGNKGKTYNTLGNVTLGIGALGLGVGTILLLTEGGSSPEASDTARREQRAPKMTVMVGGDKHGAEATLVGRF